MRSQYAPALYAIVSLSISAVVGLTQASTETAAVGLSEAESAAWT